MTEWLFASAIGVFTASGVWLVLRARTFDVVLGLTLLSYAVNLFIFAMGRLTFGAPAIVGAGRPGHARALRRPAAAGAGAHRHRDLVRDDGAGAGARAEGALRERRRRVRRRR